METQLMDRNFNPDRALAIAERSTIDMPRPASSFFESLHTECARRGGLVAHVEEEDITLEDLLPSKVGI